MSDLPIVRKLREYQPVRYIHGECWPTLGSPCGEAADVITMLTIVLKDTPIIGQTESAEAFRIRQDMWLTSKYGPAIAKVIGND